MNKGSFLFLFDGFDEVFSKSKNELSQQIENFMDLYPNNNFVLTTRPSSDIESLPRYKKFFVENLTIKEIIQFIDQQVDNKERRKRLLTIIESKQNKNYFNYLQNPLLLSMFILAFEKHPEIPQRYSSFYSNVFDTLYSQHDGLTKGSFPRERKTKFYKEEFYEILNIFSFLTFTKGIYSFTQERLEETLKKVKIFKPSINFDSEKLIYDLRTSISLIIKEGFEYKFPHRSMQEYFAASFISNLQNEKKPQAYNIIFNKTGKGIDSEESLFFWTLCFELDGTGMKKHLLIPNLKKIIFDESILNNDEELINKFLETLEISFENNPYEENDEGNLKYTFGMSVLVNNVYILLKFCKSFPKKFFKSLKIDELNQIEDLFFAEHRHLVTKQWFNEDSDFRQILIESEFSSMIRDFQKGIRKKIADLQTEIDAEEFGVDKILGIE